MSVQPNPMVAELDHRWDVGFHILKRKTVWSSFEMMRRLLSRNSKYAKDPKPDIRS
jgi:hypothetical protein